MGLEITLWVDSIRRAQDTVRDQQRKYEAAESDYARISRQLDEFDTRTEALRAEAQQLMLQVEEANAEIRTITEQNAGSESQLAVLQNETEHANEQIRSASDELTRAGGRRKGDCAGSGRAQSGNHPAANRAAKSGCRGGQAAPAAEHAGTAGAAKR